MMWRANSASPLLSPGRSGRAAQLAGTPCGATSPPSSARTARPSSLSHVKIAMSLSPRRSTRLSRLPWLLLALLFGGQAQAAGNERWVSDSLQTYVRSGPTDGYRIVGTLKSGQKVELLATQGDYSRVRSESGDSVWIPSRDLQSVPGQAERLPQLEQKVADLSAELKGIDDAWKVRVQGMQETLDSRTLWHSRTTSDNKGGDVAHRHRIHNARRPAARRLVCAGPVAEP